MPLISCKIEISLLKWYQNCILSSAGTAAIFTITVQNFMFQLLLQKLKIMQNYQNY